MYFVANSTTVGSGTLTAGQTTFSTSSLAVNTFSITAVYSGNSDFNSSTSSALAQTVSKAGVSTTLTSSVNPSVYGQSVSFTGTVTPISPGAGTPTGMETFEDGSTTLGTLTLSSGAATYTSSTLALGLHSITAVYDGDGNFISSTSAVVTQTVSTNSSTSLTSSVNPSVFGQAIIFTATVSAVSPITGTPTGTVTFDAGSTSIGSATLTAGQGTLSFSMLAAGTYTITAVYGGAGTFTGSSTTLTQTVNQASTTTSVVSSINPDFFGQLITFTATVSPVSPGAGYSSGTVTFLDGSTTLGTGTLGADQATFATLGLTAGNHSITAVYGGDSNFLGSTSSAITQVVDTVTGSPFAAAKGQGFSGAVAAFAPFAGTTLSDYSATILWGDGATSAGTITAAGTLYNVTGSHTYAEEGPYLPSVEVDEPVIGGAAPLSTSPWSCRWRRTPPSSTSRPGPSLNPAASPWSRATPGRITCRPAAISTIR